MRHLSLVKLLCNYKAKIFGCWADGYNPLHIAAHQNQSEIVNLLLQQPDADVNNLTPYGKTPLYIATVKGHYLIAEELLRRGALINMACLDKKNKMFTTVLHATIENNNLDFLKLCITNNAHLDVVNNKKQTPLHLAVLKDNIMTTKILVRHGTVVSIKKSGKIL